MSTKQIKLDELDMVKLSTVFLWEDNFETAIIYQGSLEESFRTNTKAKAETVHDRLMPLLGKYQAIYEAYNLAKSDLQQVRDHELYELSAGIDNEH